MSVPALGSLSESSAPAAAGAPVPARRRRGARNAPKLSLVPARSGVAVEMVVPVYNEEHVLAASVATLHEHMASQFTFPFRITIADNASVDATPAVARSLAQELDHVEFLRLERKGRGLALRAAWSASEAEVLAYMDVDLSTDLSSLGDLLAPLLESRADMTIGSRLAPGAEVTRGLRREVISRSYNILLRTSLGLGISDAQCGFKAIRREVLTPLLDLVKDDSWFFDTELLYHARRSRLAIHEIPVRWVEDPDSRVQILATAREDLQGIRRLRRAGRRPAAAGPGSGLTPGMLARPSRRTA
ncbi:MAG TPA: dolichyl-phosphate beta-glucosyltransferase [Solirubrobacteraceae bacterium]|nr:dolichyl-phosphate beta-glucosyltransferase [Solirubrobacteraceae bacterium]